MARSNIATFNPGKSLVRVGGGRGFVMQEPERHQRRYIISAAHCLPAIPRPPGMREGQEETFQNILGPLDGEITVSADCVYVDPISDIVVLGTPNSEEAHDEVDAYAALIEPLALLRPGDAALTETPAYLIALDGHLIDCTVHHLGGPLLIENATDEIVPGMSGSPILSREGAAIGVVSQSHRTQGMSPRLIANLPGWLLLNLGASSRLSTARRELRADYRRGLAEIQRFRRAGLE
jgi:hypothetical protein